MTTRSPVTYLARTGSLKCLPFKLLGFSGLRSISRRVLQRASTSRSKRKEDLGFVEDDVVETVLNDQPIRRYDWRKRATSRLQKNVDLSALPKGYKRRVRKTPAEFISEKELALRPAVRNYSEKYAVMSAMC